MVVIFQLTFCIKQEHQHQDFEKKNIFLNEIHQTLILQEEK